MDKLDEFAKAVEEYKKSAIDCEAKRKLYYELNKARDEAMEAYNAAIRDKDKTKTNMLSLAEEYALEGVNV